MLERKRKMIRIFVEIGPLKSGDGYNMVENKKFIVYNHFQ